MLIKNKKFVDHENINLDSSDYLITNEYLEFFDKFISDYKAKKSNYPTYSLLTVSCNNSYMTMRMIESFLLSVDCNFNIYIADNGTMNKIHPLLCKHFNIIDNFNNKLLPNLNDISKNHANTVDYCFKNIISTDNVILCDNDILFKPTILNLLNDNIQFDIIGNTENTFVPKERVIPTMFILNLKRFKDNKINFFDPARTKVPCKKSTQTLLIDNQYYDIIYTYLYDTGASFYEDIKNIFNFNKIELNDYIEHLGGLSYIKYLLNCYNNNNINKKYKSLHDFLKINKCLLKYK